MSSQNGNHPAAALIPSGDGIKVGKRQSEEVHHHHPEAGAILKKTKGHQNLGQGHDHPNGSADKQDGAGAAAEQGAKELITATTTYEVEDESTADSERQVYLDNGDDEDHELEDDIEDLPEKFQDLQWEDSYVRKMAEFVGANGGKILQIGFGTGIGANAIQECTGVKEHYIVEDDDELIDFLENWSVDHPNVTVLRAPWEEATKEFPDQEFDGVIFYLHPHLPEIQHTSQFEFISKVGYRVLKKGGHLSYCNLRSWDDHMKNFENDIMKMFEETQIKKLKEIGFSEDNIEMELEQVSVPEDCKYYSHEQVMLVKLTK